MNLHNIFMPSRVLLCWAWSENKQHWHSINRCTGTPKKIYNCRGASVDPTIKQWWFNSVIRSAPPKVPAASYTFIFESTVSLLRVEDNLGQTLRIHTVFCTVYKVHSQLSIQALRLQRSQVHCRRTTCVSNSVQSSCARPNYIPSTFHIRLVHN